MPLAKKIAVYKTKLDGGGSSSRDKGNTAAGGRTSLFLLALDGHHRECMTMALKIATEQ